MDKLNVNMIDATQAASDVTSHVLGIAPDGSLKRVEVTPSLSDTYSRDTIDQKDIEVKAYTDAQISALIGGATIEQLDTLKKLADALALTGDAVVAINAELAKKYGPDNKPTAADVGLGNVPNLIHTANVAPDTVVVRDGAGDVNCRLLRSDFPVDSGSMFNGAIAYRVNNTDNTFLRFCDDKSAIKGWLGVTPAEIGAFPSSGGTLTGPLGLSGGLVAGAVPIYSSDRVGFVTDSASSQAQGVNAGNLLVSDSWNDSDKVPYLGIYSKGNIYTGGEFRFSGGLNTFGKLKHSNVFNGESWITALDDADPDHAAIGVSQDWGPQCYVNRNRYRLYGQHFKPTPSELGALPEKSDSAYNFLNNANQAQRVNTGGLLTSDNYTDEKYVPYLGIYSKGTIKTNALNAFETIGGKIRANTPQVMSLDGGVYSFVTSPSDTHLCKNAYWDGTSWLKYSNSETSGVLTVTNTNSDLMFHKSVAGDTNPLSTTFSVYHTGNKPTLGELGAQSRSEKLDSFAGSSVDIRGQDFLIHGKRAMVGRQDGVLVINYGGDFQQGVAINGNISASVLKVDTVIEGGRVAAGYDSGIAGSISCSNWFRSSDNSGWYNETYGGGIYMSDSGYVRVYGKKNFHVESGAADSISTVGGIRADGAFYGNGSGLHSIPYSAVAGQWVNIAKHPAGSCAVAVDLPTPVLNHLNAGGTVEFRIFQNQHNRLDNSARRGVNFFIDGSDGWASSQYESDIDWINAAYTRVYNGHASNPEDRRNKIWGQYPNISKVDYRLL